LNAASTARWPVTETARTSYSMHRWNSRKHIKSLNKKRNVRIT